MIRTSFSGRLAVLGALSLCVAPSAATAAPVPVFSPIVTLSILGSGVSAAALCGAAVTSAAQAPASGCVLPAIDLPPPVAVVAPPPPAPFPVAVAAPAVAGTGFLVPLIGGLAALVAILALISFGKDNPNGNALPPAPITPQ